MGAPIFCHPTDATMCISTSNKNTFRRN